MKIIVVNVNTSESMTGVIAAGAWRYASPGTEIEVLRPYFGPQAVDCAFETYLSAVGVMDRVLAYREQYDAVVLAGFGEHGRDGLQELIRPPVVEICEASAQVAMLIARTFSVVTTLQRSVPAIGDRLKLAGRLRGLSQPGRAHRLGADRPAVGPDRRQPQRIPGHRWPAIHPCQAVRLPGWRYRQAPGARAQPSGRRTSPSPCPRQRGSRVR